MRRIKSTRRSDTGAKVPTHFIMTVILPCTMLACKDQFNASQEQLTELGVRIERYMGHITSGAVSLAELNSLLTVTDSSRKKQSI